MAKKVENIQVVQALLTYDTIAEASKHLGVHPSTITKRKQDKDFKKLYEEQQRKQLEIATKQLEATITQAVKTIKTIMLDEANTPQIRLNASEMLLRNTLKYNERTNVLERLNELEEMIKDNERNN